MNLFVQFVGEIVIQYLDKKSGGKVSRTIESASEHIEKKHDIHMKKVERKEDELDRVLSLVKSQNFSYETLIKKYPDAGGTYKLALGKEIKERNKLISEYVKKIESSYYTLESLEELHDKSDGELKAALKYVINKN
ncbi:hypothetical protein EXIGUO8H_40438 [Exiguobacterium sp. 8H]|uniref:hypothetical protein n=1 Tax=unclassified Exiguobacterium TaxID=2644629 RepID=UPI0012EF2643|nr:MULTISPECIES: hypothetical protein [unclassified Exiguobacterium]VXC00166.1 hypothetical protein EXIGUO8H_40438 [Exiguobacterium sp. 8H]VXC20939.1 hypothetical protein EXIGUO8A_80390 [Exiguobacterium sp. 8A]